MDADGDAYEAYINWQLCLPSARSSMGAAMPEQVPHQAHRRTNDHTTPLTNHPSFHSADYYYYTAS